MRSAVISHTSAKSEYAKTVDADKTSVYAVAAFRRFFFINPVVIAMYIQEWTIGHSYEK